MLPRVLSRHPWLRPAVGVVAVFVALVTWALSSAVGSSPDEDFHLGSVWCGQGLRDGVCEAGTDPTTRQVPTSIVNTPCYAFKPEDSAACQGDRLTEPDGAMELTNRGNFTGDYPPVYYWTLSHLVGPDVERSVVAMRVLAAFVVVLVSTAVAALVSTGQRRGLVLAMLVCAVPYGTFFVGSINPSGWTLYAAALLMVATVGFLTARERWRTYATAAVAVPALLLAAGSRADGALYAALGVVVAVVIAGRVGRPDLPRLAYAALLAAVAGWSFLSAGQSSAVEAQSGEPFSLLRLSRVLLQVPSLWVGSFGTWNLGWLDTAMPAVVWVAALACFFGCVFAALTGLGRRRGLALALVALAVAVVPSYIQYIADAPVGEQVQSRYVFPLVVLLAATAMTRTTGAAFVLSVTQRWLVVGALAVANAVALHVNLARYLTGDDNLSLNPDTAREWWWNTSVTPLTVWLVGSAAFAVALWALTAELRTPAPADEVLGERPAVAVPAADGTAEDGTTAE
ncbi:DUF2142 domain-containing protein, partial [Cellulomonas algicola]|uniref:DUF2142 domain-containing protein n=1 Tax=Cellulomonas algicola TaxID=2071633 RepID=UPI000F589E76